MRIINNTTIIINNKAKTINNKAKIINNKAKIINNNTKKSLVNLIIKFPFTITFIENKEDNLSVLDEYL